MKSLLNYLQVCVEKTEAKVAFRTAIAGTIGLAVGSHLNLLSNRPDRLLSGMWCVLTAIIVLQAYIGSTYKAAWNRFFGVLIGSLMGGVFTSFLGSNPLTLGIGIFFTVALCSIFQIKESYRIASASVAVIIILWGLTPEVNPWIFSLYRFIDSLFGIIIAMAVAHGIWPREAIDKITINFTSLFQQLDAFFQIAIDFERKSRPLEAQEKIDEINTLIQEGRELLEQSKPDLFATTQKAKKWEAILDKCQQLVESFATLDSVFKRSTWEILNAPLLNCIQEKITLIHKGFQLLSQYFSTGTFVFNHEPEIALNELKEELARFRSTHSTREYSLEHVENFFIFCHSLKGTLEVLQAIERDIKEINEMQ